MPKDTPPPVSQAETSDGSHIWGVIECRKMFQQQQNIFLFPLGENEPGDDIPQQKWHDFCWRE